MVLVLVMALLAGLGGESLANTSLFLLCNLFTDDNFTREYMDKNFKLSGEEAIIEYESCNQAFNRLFGSIQTQIADISWGTGITNTQNWGNLCRNMSKFLSTLDVNEFRMFLHIHGRAVKNAHPELFDYDHAAGAGFAESSLLKGNGSIRIVKNSILLINNNKSGKVRQYLKLLNGYVLSGQFDKARTILHNKKALGNFSLRDYAGMCEFARITEKREGGGK
ncbi:MAG: hypothetical protein BWY70_01789 [Bacteroidetes bacterium ADurb.Bin408]|nr:MAG: hypothetical protein BWY70_01789 [Bacteroidetes bacterium ADurb.Bin408]